MYWNHPTFPFRIIAVSLVMALLFALLFFWIRRYVVPLIHDRATMRSMDRWLPRIEIAVWSLFTVIVLIALVQTDPLITAGSIVLLGFAGWRVWKDVFTGLFFRMAARFMPGDPIEVGTIKGHVVRAGSRDVEVALGDGGKAWIPYHRLANEVIGQHHTPKDLLRSSFKITLAGSTIDTYQRIERSLRRDPWVAAARPIYITSNEDGSYTIDLHLVDAEVLLKVQHALTKALGDKVTAKP